MAFENAVSMCEIINSKSTQVQVLGKVPTVSIDKCDGAQVGALHGGALGLSPPPPFRSHSVAVAHRGCTRRCT